VPTGSSSPDDVALHRRQKLILVWAWGDIERGILAWISALVC
jgi:hypothetical protein